MGLNKLKTIFKQQIQDHGLPCRFGISFFHFLTRLLKNLNTIMNLD